MVLHLLKPNLRVMMKLSLRKNPEKEKFPQLSLRLPKTTKLRLKKQLNSDKRRIFHNQQMIKTALPKMKLEPKRLKVLRMRSRDGRIIGQLDGIERKGVNLHVQIRSSNDEDEDTIGEKEARMAEVEGAKKQIEDKKKALAEAETK